MAEHKQKHFLFQDVRLNFLPPAAKRNPLSIRTSRSGGWWPEDGRIAPVVQKAV